MSSGSQSARDQQNAFRGRSHSKDVREEKKQHVRVDSEKSQFTQESCSANESQDEAYGGVRNLIQTSAQKVKTEASPDKWVKPKLQIKSMLHFKSTDEENALDQLLAENPRDAYNPEIEGFEESKEDAPLSGFPLTNRSSPQKDKFCTFSQQETSVQQIRRRKESNPPSSQNNMLSNEDYNYSPDFKECGSILPIEQQSSENFSPLIMLKKSSTFGTY